MPKTHERNTTPLVEARKELSAKKLESLRIALNDLLMLESPITIPNVCKATGLSKSFLYKNEEAKLLFQNAKIKSQAYSPRSKAIPQNNVPQFLQYEEVKRKLEESYILQYQLLSNENERLKNEIKMKEEKIEKLRNK